MVELVRRDVVEPVEIAAGTGFSSTGAELYEPTPGRTFDHATTSESTSIPVTMTLSGVSTGLLTASNLGVSTTSASSDIGAALVALASRVNTVELLLNRAVYVLETNGFTS